MGGEVCKLLLRDELKLLGKQGTKLSQASLPLDEEGGGWPGSIFVLKQPVLKRMFLLFDTGIPMGSPFKEK